MDFCKIKPKHILFNDLTHAQIGRIIIIQCLTANLDRLPTNQEICKFMSQKQLESVEKHFQTVGKTLANVLQKVLEDVEDVLDIREYWKVKRREARQKLASCPRQSPSDVKPLDKTRLDKTRLDKTKERGAFAPPSFDQVKDYCLKRFNNVDAQKFIDFYQSKNWMIGKNKMSDWQAAVRTWENRKDEVKGIIKESKFDQTIREAKKYAKANDIH